MKSKASQVRALGPCDAFVRHDAQTFTWRASKAGHVRHDAALGMACAASGCGTNAVDNEVGSEAEAAASVARRVREAAVLLMTLLVYDWT